MPRVKVPVEFVSSEPKMPGHSVGAAFVPHRFAGPNLHFFFWRTSGSETAFQKATKGTHCGQDLASGKIARFWSVVCRCELREGSRSVQMAIRLANVQLGCGTRSRPRAESNASTARWMLNISASSPASRATACVSSMSMESTSRIARGCSRSHK